MRTGRTRIVAALVLTTALAGAPAQAAGSPAQQDWRWPSLAEVWAWLSGTVLPPQDTVQTDCGSHIDPDGRCAVVSTVQRDCGIMIDPNGYCIASAVTGASAR